MIPTTTNPIGAYPLPPLEGLVSYWSFEYASELELPDLVGRNHLKANNGVNGCDNIVNNAGIYFGDNGINYRASLVDLPLGNDEGMNFAIVEYADRETRFALDYGQARSNCERAIATFASRFQNLMYNVYCPGQLITSAPIGRPVLIVSGYRQGAEYANIYAHNFLSTGELFDTSRMWPSGTEITENIFVTQQGNVTIGARVTNTSNWRGKIYCAGVCNKLQDPTQLFMWATNRFGTTN